MSLYDDLRNGIKEAEAYLAGERAGYKVTVPAAVDVKAIRQRLHMTQAAFSQTFGFSLDAVKHWEGGRRLPETAARAYLTVIDKAPETVFAVLQPERGSRTLKSTPSKRVVKSAPRRGAKLSKANAA
jgi:putative transcriptional regulator